MSWRIWGPYASIMASIALSHVLKPCRFQWCKLQQEVKPFSAILGCPCDISPLGERSQPYTRFGAWFWATQQTGIYVPPCLPFAFSELVQNVRHLIYSCRSSHWCFTVCNLQKIVKVLKHCIQKMVSENVAMFSNRWSGKLKFIVNITGKQ